MLGIVTFTMIASMMFVLGGKLTSLVFVACISSYSTVSGTGLMQNLLMKAGDSNKEDNREKEIICQSEWEMHYFKLLPNQVCMRQCPGNLLFRKTAEPNEGMVRVDRVTN